MNSEGEFFKMILSNGHLADIKKIEELVGGLSAVIYGDRETENVSPKQKCPLLEYQIYTKYLIFYFYKLKDQQAKRRIRVRIDYVEDRNFRDTQPVSEGISELRLLFLVYSRLL